MPLEKKFTAYQLLRELDAVTSSIMNQIAYGRIGSLSWKETQALHREIFEKWMSFAATLDSPDLHNLGIEASRDTDSDEVRPA
ncbi:hypothetical protein C6A77_05640 [Pseudomonas sp. AFG_SD02_1510_Pfu_092]|uniref:hypothetical protein n=1 Tax=Pseudomonas sp. AFG_SD02_1510_Pfu_092 TaxID=2259497 RepID=UPI000DEFC5DD|nr:hypothetical protein [Pseudomonas sp. AFG_SD02_1510_Pfu_092]RCL28576.1 hypothetical protein C6A77_05640 [Pseudomonas sp. AFG_SD02_1510_Pfu_092]